MKINILLGFQWERTHLPHLRKDFQVRMRAQQIGWVMIVKEEFPLE